MAGEPGWNISQQEMRPLGVIAESESHFVRGVESAAGSLADPQLVVVGTWRNFSHLLGGGGWMNG